MIKSHKVTKLIKRLDDLVTMLEQHPELIIHQHIDQFYYMQKVEKFKVLLKRIQKPDAHTDLLKQQLCQDYVLTYEQWRKDFTWIVRYNHQRLHKRSIL